MTPEVKIRIKELSDSGLGYVKISKEVGLPANTVKSFIQRNRIIGKECSRKTCLYCGKTMDTSKTKRVKKFCSDKCRMSWWKENPKRLKKKAYYEFTCQYCGDSFKAYGNSKRKYCSYKHYTLDRFGGDRPWIEMN